MESFWKFWAIVQENPKAGLIVWTCMEGAVQIKIEPTNTRVMEFGRFVIHNDEEVRMF